MQRSIQYDGSGSSSFYATAEDQVDCHSSVTNFYADAYREILFQVWNDDDEMRQEIEEHLEQTPSRMEKVKFEDRIDYLRRSLDVHIAECFQPKNIWCFRNEWNVIECVVEQGDKYLLIAFQTSD